MHDTVTKIRKLIASGEPSADAAAVFSNGFQDGGLSKALSEPISTHLEVISGDALRWTRAAQKLTSGAADTKTPLLEMLFASKRLASAVNALAPFVERAEENLEDHEEISHKESGYEKEVAPFSRIDSSKALRTYLQEHEDFTLEAAGMGAQIEADLMKIVYLEHRLRTRTPNAADLYAMVVELGLDSRRHLAPTLAEGSPFMAALTTAARR